VLTIAGGIVVTLLVALTLRTSAHPPQNAPPARPAGTAGRGRAR